MTHSSYVRLEGKTLADAQAGDMFEGATNGKRYLVTRTGAPAGVEAIDLATGKPSRPWKYDKPVTLLIPVRS